MAADAVLQRHQSVILWGKPATGKTFIANFIQTVNPEVQVVHETAVPQAGLFVWTGNEDPGAMNGVLSICFTSQPSQNKNNMVEDLETFRVERTPCPHGGAWLRIHQRERDAHERVHVRLEKHCDVCEAHHVLLAPSVEEKIC